jgi:hypothetical protein
MSEVFGIARDLCLGDHFGGIDVPVEQPPDRPLIAAGARAIENEFHIINEAVYFSCSTAIGAYMFRH